MSTPTVLIWSHNDWLVGVKVRALSAVYILDVMCIYCVYDQYFNHLYYSAHPYL